MDVIKKFTLNLDPSYSSPAFIQLVESHLPLLLLPNNYSVLTVEQYLTNKYKGDFYGLLVEKQINPVVHYASLRINDLKNPGDYNGETNTVLICNTGILTSLMSLTQIEYT
jgi:hypothetical protein